MNPSGSPKGAYGTVKFGIWGMLNKETIEHSKVNAGAHSTFKKKLGCRNYMLGYEHDLEKKKAEWYNATIPN